MISHPTLSVITPVLNSADLLGQAIESLRSQAGPFEHIVVDGGSTDGTRSIAVSAGATLIDAPGSSIYEALNLGMERASGQVRGFLNSDDLLGRGALERVRETFAAAPSLDILKGRAAQRQWKNGAWFGEAITSAAPHLNLRAMLLAPPNINACFVSDTFWKKIGPFDTSYAISADREWLARAVLLRPETQCIDQVLYVYRAHEKSTTIGGAKRATEKWVHEHLRIGERFLSDVRLSSAERAIARAFFAKETAHALWLAMRRGDLQGAADVAASSTRRAPLWAVAAIPPIISVLAQRLKRAASA